MNFGSNTTVIGTVSDPAGGAITQTLNPGDSIIGTGSGNTLRVVDTLAAGATNGMAGVTMSGVQTLSVQKAAGTPGTTSTYDLSATTGVTSVVSNNSALNVTFTGLAAGTTAGVSGTNSTVPTTTTFTYASAPTAASVSINGGVISQTVVLTTSAPSAVTITSTGGTNGIGLNGVVATGTAGNTVQTANLLQLGNSASITSMTVNAATNLRATLTTADFATTGAALTVSGAATSVNLIGAGSSVVVNNRATNGGTWTTVNASGLTNGGLSINASSTLTSFIGGGGADTLRNATNGGVILAPTATIDAGAGTDTLAATLVTAGTGALFKNFEVLDLRTSTGTDAALLTNSTITGVNLTSTTTGSISAVNLVNTATGFNVTVGTNNGTVAGGITTLNLVTLGFTAASVAGTADIINFNFNNSSQQAGQLAGGSFAIAGIEIVNVNSGGVNNVTGGGFVNTLALTANSIQTVNLTGNQPVFLSVQGQAAVGSATTTALTTIDASKMTATTALTAANAGLANTFTFVESATQNTAVTVTNQIANPLNANLTAATSVASLNINGSVGNDSITVSTVRAGTGTTNYSSDVVNISQGGVDTVNVAWATAIVDSVAAVTSGVFGYTTVTGAATGDTIAFGAGTLAANTAAINVSTATSLVAAVNLSVNAAGFINWFTFGGNTYITRDATAAAAAVNLAAADNVVQLTGVYDLSTATATAGVLVLG